MTDQHNLSKLHSFERASETHIYSSREFERIERADARARLADELERRAEGDDALDVVRDGREEALESLLVARPLDVADMGQDVREPPEGLVALPGTVDGGQDEVHDEEARDRGPRGLAVAHGLAQEGVLGRALGRELRVGPRKVEQVVAVVVDAGAVRGLDEREKAGALGEPGHEVLLGVDGTHGHGRPAQGRWEGLVDLEAQGAARQGKGVVAVHDAKGALGKGLGLFID